MSSNTLWDKIGLIGKKKNLVQKFWIGSKHGSQNEKFSTKSFLVQSKSILVVVLICFVPKYEGQGIIFFLYLQYI
jgi:hypothetical protein